MGNQAPSPSRSSNAWTASLALRLDAACLCFEAAWRGGRRPQIEEFLGASSGPERTALLRELLLVELSYRQKAGERARAEEYHGRFPGDAGVIDDVFRDLATMVTKDVGHSARPGRQDKRPARPEAFQHVVSKHIECPHCQNAIELVGVGSNEVLCPSCGSSFELALGETTVNTFRAGGGQVGKFELIAVAGLGAFGIVYEARDPELDRIVALKVPRAGNLSRREDLDRFLREARSVAQLRHPKIVPVYEVGQVDQVPYLVSEFVVGITLGDLLTARRPGLREAAALVADMAEALQFAHAQGVVHRDVKPSNILISVNGNPYLTDFGLAKREAGEITMTLDGHLLGTPAYMSPEQARGEAHKVDGRSDVYSLGVVLYELLTRELPFRGNPRMLLYQVEHDEPRPPRKLNDLIPRDLETVCLKAMSKDPGRRYQTAAEFEADLRRFLNHEPVRARPVGRVERVWRWCRRNPRVAALTTTVLVLLVVLAVGSTVAALWVNRARNAAEAQREIAARNFRRATSAVDKMLTEVGFESLADVPHMEGWRRTLLEDALTYYREFVKERPTDPAIRKELAAAYHRMGDVLKWLGEHDQAREAYGQAAAHLERLTGDFPGDPEYRHLLALTYNDLGEIQRLTRPLEAEKLYARAVNLQTQLVSEFPGMPAYRQELARSHNNRGIFFDRSGRREKGTADYEAAIELLQPLADLPGARPEYQADLARALINRGVLWQNDKHPGRAADDYGRAILLLAALTKTLPDKHDYQYRLGTARNNLGNVLKEQNRYAEAEAQHRQAVAVFEKLVAGYPHYHLYRNELANSYNSWAIVLWALRRAGEAEEKWDASLTQYRELVAACPDRHEYVSRLALGLFNRAVVLVFRDQCTETGYRLASVAPGNPAPLATTLGNAGLLSCRRPELAEASQCLSEAVRWQTKAARVDPQNPQYRDHLKTIYEWWALVLRREGDQGSADQKKALAQQASGLEE